MSDITDTRLKVHQFLALPDMLGTVELIHGEVRANNPKDDHQRTAGSLFTALRQTFTAGSVKIMRTSVQFDDENFVQPDIFWVSGPESRCQLGEDGYWHGAPDLVVEVLSPSTRNQDKRD